MAAPSAVEVLLALLEPAPGDAVSGDEVIVRLAAGRVSASPARVMARLLRLEALGWVEVERHPEYRFRLTAAGEEAAYARGPGSPVTVTLVMADLGGFVAFTARRGDEVAHRAAWTFQRSAERALQRCGGAAIKSLGDGVLGTAASTDAALMAVKELAESCCELEGEPWRLRAAVHDGRPVAHRGDLLGADVNLVARLCDAARPGEVVVTGRGHEALVIRGLDQPVVVERLDL